MVKDFTKHNDTIKSATPSSYHFFNTQDNATILNTTQDKIYHSFMAKSFFVTNISRLNIHATVSFLTMQVRDPDIYYWNKIFCIMTYLHGTPNLPLNPLVGSTKIFK